MIGITRPNGETVRVVFRHFQEPVVKGEPQQPILYLHPERKRHKGPIRAYTAAILETGTKEDPITLGSGEALCSMLDNFVKETGRQIALKEALYRAKNAQLITPQEFEAITDSYNNRPRGKRAQPQTSTQETE